MTREEAYTLLEVMAINITGELIGSGHIITEQTKLLAKQLEAIDMAQKALSIDAVQGEWVRVGHDIYECSLCHQNVMTKDIDCYSYCHRCGASMQNGFKSVGQAWNTEQRR